MCPSHLASRQLCPLSPHLWGIKEWGLLACLEAFEAGTWGGGMGTTGIHYEVAVVRSRAWVRQERNSEMAVGGTGTEGIERRPWWQRWGCEHHTRDWGKRDL